MKAKVFHIGLIVLSIVLLTLASPGFDVPWLAFIAYVPVLYVMKQNALRPWLAGLFFGLGYYMVNLKWVITTVSYYGQSPVILGVIALIAFALYLSLFTTLFGYLAGKKDEIVVLAMVFVVLEVIRSYALTGFPWLNLGLTQHSNGLILPLVSLVGEYGLSFLIILINLLIAKILLDKKFLFIIPIVVLLMVMVISGLVVSKKENVIGDQPMKIKVIQPAYDQLTKWEFDVKHNIFDSVLFQIEDAVFSDADMIVLPEAVFPASIERETEVFEHLLKLSESKPIILGSIRRDAEGRSFNSVYYLNNGQFAIYDKRHLVPFGEYFPFPAIFQPISSYFFGDADDFIPGGKAAVFDHKDAGQIGPLVCFESAFTHVAQETINNGADLLMVLTNDTWFGQSIGQEQHLAVSAMRAAESGKPMIRATQSGISACLDSNGSVLKTLGSGKPGVMDCEIGFRSENTVFTHYQYGWVILVIGFLILGNVRRKHNKD